ncbi:hypothetical protein [Burkholderia pseudomallei]
MSLFPLIPLLVPISSVAIVIALNGIDKNSADEQMALGIYKQSKGLRIFLWCGALLFFGSPFLFELSGIQFTAMDWYVSAAIDVCILACCIYAERNFVRLERDSFVFRGFATVEVKYGDVASLRRKVTAKGNRYLIITGRNGRKVSISGYINGFSDLVEKLSRKVEGRTR